MSFYTDVTFEKVKSLKRWSWNSVYHAIEMGELEAPSTCSQCGREAKIKAHHADYTKPFEIVWLCQSCHGLLHNQIKRDILVGGELVAEQ